MQLSPTQSFAHGLPLRVGQRTGKKGKTLSVWDYLNEINGGTTEAHAEVMWIASGGPSSGNIFKISICLCQDHSRAY